MATLSLATPSPQKAGRLNTKTNPPRMSHWEKDTKVGIDAHPARRGCICNDDGALRISVPTLAQVNISRDPSIMQQEGLLTLMMNNLNSF